MGLLERTCDRHLSAVVPGAALSRDAGAMSGRPPLFESQESCRLVWQERFKLPGEARVEDSLRRVAETVYSRDPLREEQEPMALGMMLAGAFCPGGRLLALAGAEPPGRPPDHAARASIGRLLAIEGQPIGILRSLEAAVSGLRRGGDVEMDVTSVPPAGARLGRGDALAAGIVPLLDIWEAMAQRVLGEGEARRSRLTAMLSCDHPDLPAFVAAQSEAERLSRLRLLVLVSDAFMSAVANDGDWELGHSSQPADPGSREIVRDRVDAEGAVLPWFVYQVVSARALWAEMIRHGNAEGETSLAFVDRLGARKTHVGSVSGDVAIPAPCWDPLVQGAINLAGLASSAGTSSAAIDDDSLRAVVSRSVRFLDNAIDIMPSGSEEQAAESFANRRIGLGLMGLGSFLQMRGLPFDSEEARREARRLMSKIRDAAYWASIALAQERGSFPEFEPSICLVDDNLRALPEILKRGIESRGLRNRSLLCATSDEESAYFFGGVSPGVGPVPALRWTLERRSAAGTPTRYRCYDWGFLEHCRREGLGPETVDLSALGPSWATAAQLGVEDQLAFQATLQTFLDTPLDSAITVPGTMDVREQEDLFQRAYALGCQRCVVRRERAVSVDREPGMGGFEEDGPEPMDSSGLMEAKRLANVTYKESWPPLKARLFVTIFDEVYDDGRRRPCDVQIRCKSDGKVPELTCFARALSQALREGSKEMVERVLCDLERISEAEATWVRGRLFSSLPALIAAMVRRHLAATVILSGQMALQQR